MSFAVSGRHFLAIFLILAPIRAGAETSCAQSYGLFARTKAAWVVYRGKVASKLDAKGFAIFEKVRENPDLVLSAEDSAWLEKQKLGALLDRYRSTNAAIRKLNELIAVQLRSQPMKLGTLDWKRGFLDAALLGFTPGLPVGPSGRAKGIYARALKTMNFELSPRDREFLTKWKFDADFDRFRREAQEYRPGYLMATRLREAGNGLRWSVIGGGAAAAALAPQLGAERIESGERLERKVAEIKGGVQLLYSDDPDYGAILRTDGEAVVFQMSKAKFYKGDKLRELEAEIARKKLSYTRVAFRADPGEARRIMAKAKEFVTRTRTNGDGKKELDLRMYFDSPVAESYKILEAELGLPPAPIVKRHQSFMNAYFSLMNLAGEKRIAGLIRARVGEGVPGEAREAAGAAVDAYFNGLMYAVGGKLLVPAALGLDAAPNTIIKRPVPIQETDPPASAADK